MGGAHVSTASDLCIVRCLKLRYLRIITASSLLPASALAREVKAVGIILKAAIACRGLCGGPGAAASRRRFALKYTVITPANQRATDRFAFLDAYEFEGVAYMLFTSAGATKWEGGEKERCERIADSFVIAPTL